QWLGSGSGGVNQPRGYVSRNPPACQMQVGSAGGSVDDVVGAVVGAGVVGGLDGGSRTVVVESTVVSVGGTGDGSDAGGSLEVDGAGSAVGEESAGPVTTSRSMGAPRSPNTAMTRIVTAMVEPVATCALRRPRPRCTTS